MNVQKVNVLFVKGKSIQEFITLLSFVQWEPSSDRSVNEVYPVKTNTV